MSPLFAAPETSGLANASDPPVPGMMSEPTWVPDEGPAMRAMFERAAVYAVNWVASIGTMLARPSLPPLRKMQTRLFCIGSAASASAASQTEPQSRRVAE